MLSIITKFAWESGGKPFQLWERSLDLSNEKRICTLNMKQETKNGANKCRRTRNNNKICILYIEKNLSCYISLYITLLTVLLPVSHNNERVHIFWQSAQSLFYQTFGGFRHQPHHSPWRVDRGNFWRIFLFFFSPPRGAWEEALLLYKLRRRGKTLLLLLPRHPASAFLENIKPET